MAPIRCTRTPTGPRVYIMGWRLHHGAVGLSLVVCGAALTLHDRRDWPFTDRCNH